MGRQENCNEEEYSMTRFTTKGSPARAFALLADEGPVESTALSRSRRMAIVMMIVGTSLSLPLFWASVALGDDASAPVAVLKDPGPGHDGDGDDDDDEDDGNSGPGGATDQAGGTSAGNADTAGTTAGTGVSNTAASQENGVTDHGDTSANGDDTAGTTAHTGASVTQQGTREGGVTDAGGDTSANGDDTAGTTAGTGASVTND